MVIREDYTIIIRLCRMIKKYIIRNNYISLFPYHICLFFLRLNIIEKKKRIEFVWLILVNDNIVLCAANDEKKNVVNIIVYFFYGINK